MNELDEAVLLRSFSISAISGMVQLGRGRAAMEIGKASLVFPIRNFHRAKPLLKSFGRNLVAKALAMFMVAYRKL